MARETPDQILERIEGEELRRARGRLKIFFGYAAGVGKTYARLVAAPAATRRGTNVVAGYIEPHTRPETMELLKGLEVLPPLRLAHKGITLRDFDLDGALRRKPQLILVDELAHTNAEGCRHAKRYQDIEELRKAGIDVYTTVNVQHIESLNDIVASITGVLVRERIPDHVFDEADQVEMVDIEPADLIERLREGKVYRPRQAEQALGNFFTVENLTALREIALRRAADRVNFLAERAKYPAAEGFSTDEHVLVCLSSSPSNPKILRAAARLAKAFRGGFTALFVETPAYERMSPENKERLRANIRLAEQLGARIETAFGEDIAFQIAEYARHSGVSKIVMGRGNTRRRFGFGPQTFAERLTAFAPNMDIYIIPDRAVPPYRPLRPASGKRKYRLRPLAVAQSLLVLLAASLIGAGFAAMGLSEANIITVYILGVLIIATVTGDRLCSGVSALLSVLIFNFLFTDPRFKLIAYDPGYAVTFLVMFLAAFLTGSLADRLHRQAEKSAQVASRTAVLLETNQLLQQEKSPEGILGAAAKQLIKLLGRTVVFYTPQGQGLSAPAVFPAGGEGPGAYLAPNEQAVAAWVFKNNKRAGATTATLGNAKCLYLAIRSPGGVYGVAGVALPKGDSLDAFENSLLLSILGECSLALEKELYSRRQAEAAIQAKNEQLRANLLRSISHDLRTPLTSISGNAGVLMASGAALREEKKQQLYADIYDDAMWLVGLVENLLSVTRIEDGEMRLSLQGELVEEVITEALRHINRKSAEHTIQVELKDDLLLAKMDARLIIQVLINLVDNAVKYTPQGSHITISADRGPGQTVEIRVADDGPGIPGGAKPKLFDMFYTAGNAWADSRRGLGLGLALCKSIVSAHGGAITVTDNVPHGTVFTFTLQAEEVKLHE